MIDETKFEKLEKEDLEAANGGVNVGGVEYQYTKGWWTCMDTSKFQKSPDIKNEAPMCGNCTHFHPTDNQQDIYYSVGYCDAKTS